jgi:hypothetical protein
MKETNIISAFAETLNAPKALLSLSVLPDSEKAH